MATVYLAEDLRHERNPPEVASPAPVLPMVWPPGGCASCHQSSASVYSDRHLPAPPAFVVAPPALRDF